MAMILRMRFLSLLALKGTSIALCIKTVTIRRPTNIQNPKQCKFCLIDSDVGQIGYFNFGNSSKKKVNWCYKFSFFFYRKNTMNEAWVGHLIQQLMIIFGWHWPTQCCHKSSFSSYLGKHHTVIHSNTVSSSQDDLSNLNFSQHCNWILFSMFQYEYVYYKKGN